MAAGLRRHGDVFPEPNSPLGDQIWRYEIPQEFPRDTGKYRPKYSYPPTFNRGTGRVELINTRLLPMFGMIGGFGNALYNEDKFVERLPFFTGSAKEEIRSRSYNIRCDMRQYCDVASSLIGEVVSIGGVFHIPSDLQELVVKPHMYAGCLPNLLYQYFPEQYTVPYKVPVARCRLKLEEILSDKNCQLWESKSVGFCNSALAKIYSGLGYTVNRVVYHESLRNYLNQLSKHPILSDNDLQTLRIFDEFLPKSDIIALKESIKQMVILVDKAIDIIDKRFAREGDRLNMMPVDLRDKIMEILIPKWRQPRNNVSFLYSEEIKAFKGRFEDPNWPVIPSDLSNMTTLIGVASRDALIEAAGGIFELSRWDPDLVADTHIIQRSFEKTMFCYLTTDENKTMMGKAMSGMCLNALKVDIYRARTTVRTTHYGECLLVHAQDLAEQYERLTLNGRKWIYTKLAPKI